MAKILSAPPCSVCGEPSVARRLCSTHYQRWHTHGHVGETRPQDWGSKSSHPLYGIWCWTSRVQSGRVERWNNFWNFVADVGDRPSPQHKLRRKDTDQPFSPENCYWSQVVGSTDDRNHYLREWRRKNPEMAKAHGLRMSRGMLLAEYDALLAKQNGVCAICKQPEKTVIRGKLLKLAVDHCHHGNGIRGLLCRECNNALGLFKDNISLLRSAVDYLVFHQATPNKEIEIDIPPVIAATMLKPQEPEEDAPLPPRKPREKPEPRPCAVEGCSRQHYGNGFCKRHYRQAKAGHDPHALAKKTCKECGTQIGDQAQSTALFCSVACKMRWYRAQGCYTEEAKKANRDPCSVDGCEKPVEAAGMCRPHYMKAWHAKYGRSKSEFWQRQEA